MELLGNRTSVLLGLLLKKMNPGHLHPMTRHLAQRLVALYGHFYQLRHFFGGGVRGVLGLELRAFTLSHSISPIFVKDFS
jgi:hypothetical protein